MTTFFDKLKDLVSENKTELALNSLLKYLRHNQPNQHEWEKQVLLLKGRIEESSKHFDKGQTTFEEAAVNETRIESAILNLIVEIETEVADNSEDNSDGDLFIKASAAEKEKALANFKRKAAIWGLAISLLVLAVYFFVGNRNKKLVKPIVQLDRKTAEILTEAAHSFRQDFKYPKAIEQATAAIAKDSTFAEAFNLRAECYLLTDERQKAIKDAQRAVELEPNDKDGFHYSTLAQCYAEISETEFYYFLEKALIQGFQVWEYTEEIGFSKRKDETRFKDLVKKYKK